MRSEKPQISLNLIRAMVKVNYSELLGQARFSNGKKEVPSFLFDPVVVDKSNLETTVVADGHIKASDLK